MKMACRTLWTLCFLAMAQSRAAEIIAPARGISTNVWVVRGELISCEPDNGFPSYRIVAMQGDSDAREVVVFSTMAGYESELPTNAILLLDGCAHFKKSRKTERFSSPWFQGIRTTPSFHTRRNCGPNSAPSQTRSWPIRRPENKCPFAMRSKRSIPSCAKNARDRNCLFTLRTACRTAGASRCSE